MRHGRPSQSTGGESVTSKSMGRFNAIGVVILDSAPSQTSTGDIRACASPSSATRVYAPAATAENWKKPFFWQGSNIEPPRRDPAPPNPLLAHGARGKAWGYVLLPGRTLAGRLEPGFEPLRKFFLLSYKELARQRTGRSQHDTGLQRAGERFGGHLENRIGSKVAGEICNQSPL